jgi:predicted cation transporter
MFIGLYLILLAALVVPFFVRKVEEQIEVFLFILGCVAVTITSQWSSHLVKESLFEPVKITLAVLVAGCLFRFFQRAIADNVARAVRALGVRRFAFLTIAALGLLSSCITAIIAALVLVEIISVLTLDRKSEVAMVVLACFSIGMGAALTPIGEPLSTIAIAKLKGAPYHADFFFIARQLGVFILPGIFFFSALSFIFLPEQTGENSGLSEERRENIRDILIRTFKVYLFVMALIFLGQGFKPLIDAHISRLPYQGLYWINSISAVLDNATIVAAEIGPGMSMIQIKSALLGLLVAGGMLIPGNIPNIIAANKLKIRSSEWARVGLPLGFVVMGVYFFIIIAIG